MNTTIYFVRHGETNDKNSEKCCENKNAQIKNEKNILSINGETAALKLSKNKELLNIDIIYSSHYARTMGTAKYIAHNNNLLLNIDENLGERIIGVDNWNDFPSDFHEHQFKDWNYKIDGGESLNETSIRMHQTVNKLISENRHKKICIVTHGMSLITLFKNYFDYTYNTKTNRIEFYNNETLIYDGNFKTPDLFKLTFNNKNKLIDFKNID